MYILGRLKLSETLLIRSRKQAAREARLWQASPWWFSGPEALGAHSPSELLIRVQRWAQTARAISIKLFCLELGNGELASQIP